MANRIRGKKEGSISKRPNGHWRAQISQKDGQRISHDFNTKPEAQEWLRTMQTQLDQGYDYHGAKGSLEKYLIEWLETCRLSLRDMTIVHYEQVIRKHIIPWIGTTQLADLSL